MHSPYRTNTGHIPETLYQNNALESYLKMQLCKAEAHDFNTFNYINMKVSSHDVCGRMTAPIDLRVCVDTSQLFWTVSVMTLER